MRHHWLDYPGGHHLHVGLPQLRQANAWHELSDSALVLMMARPKLMSLGIDVPTFEDWQKIDAASALCDRLRAQLADEHAVASAFRALRDEIISFAQTYAQLACDSNCCDLSSEQ